MSQSMKITNVSLNQKAAELIEGTGPEEARRLTKELFRTCPSLLDLLDPTAKQQIQNLIETERQQQMDSALNRLRTENW